MNTQANIREEELKNRVAALYFGKFDCTRIVGNIDFCAPPTSFTYTADGGLASDGTWSYAYDAEDQLTSVTSSSLTNGAIRVLNTYDYRHRRTSKTVQRLYSTIAPPPSPPVGGARGSDTIGGTPR